MLRLDFIRTDTGDAILVRETGGERPFTMLVDAGNAPSCEEGNEADSPVCAFLKKEGINRLDLFVLSHLYRDHLAGALAMVKAVPNIRRMFVNYLPESLPSLPLSPDSPDGPLPPGVLLGLSRQIGLAEGLKQAGTQVDIISSPIREEITKDLTLEATSCGRYLYKRYKTELDRLVEGQADRYAIKLMRAYLNLTSIRLILTYHGKRIFLPGDAYATYWDVDAQGPCHILKVPHHASKAGVTPLLLDRLQPEIAVVSVSPGNPEKPHPDSVALLKERVPQVLFTAPAPHCGIQGDFSDVVTLTVE